jgi:hypothetical protein
MSVKGLAWNFCNLSGMQDCWWDNWKGIHYRSIPVSEQGLKGAHPSESIPFYFLSDDVQLLEIHCSGSVNKDKVVPGFNWAPRHGGVLGSGGISPRILVLGTRWRWVVSFTSRPPYPKGKSPWYPLDRRLDGPQSRSGYAGEEKNS